MKDINTPIYIELEIYSEDTQELKEALLGFFNSSDFKDELKVELLERLQIAIREKRDKINLFRLAYYGVDLVVKKNQFKNLLKKVLEMYQEEEDYLKCVEVKNLIDEI